MTLTHKSQGGYPSLSWHNLIAKTAIHFNVVLITGYLQERKYRKNLKKKKKKERETLRMIWKLMDEKQNQIEFK